MLPVRYWLARLRDRRSVLRPSRSSFRRRPWWRRRLLWLAALGIVVLLASGLWFSLFADVQMSGRVVTITRASTDQLYLDGQPYSLRALETKLGALQREPQNVAAVLPVSDREVEAMLNRQRIAWVSPGEARGGDHGR